jgi:signal transduction histidine kinase/DNA-binding response OmpR family regulator
MDSSVPSPAAGHATPERMRNFDVSVQRSRIAVYGLAALLGIAGWLAGALDVDLAAGLGLLGTGVTSAVLIEALARRGLFERWRFELALGWLALDVVVVTVYVALTGGLPSPCYLWYLSPAAAAAFALGPKAAHGVAAACLLAYVAVLAFLGQIHGLDSDLGLALARMAFLYGAAFFFLRGIGRLQEHQRLLKEVQEDEHLKLEELIRLTQDLDQGTRALAFANVQIREADRVKSQFLANMSHELRTPLNSIIGFSEILQDQLRERISPKYLKFLANIHSSGEHLLAVINDILDLSKVEAGKMEMRPESIHVRSVIEGVVSVMHGMASGSNRIDVDVPADLPRLETDPVRFKQILYNLLSNAIKFSPDGTPVRVEAQLVPAAASPLHQDSLTISVIDHGIGIAPSDHEIVFHEFRQVDGGVSRRFGGTGLGLALVKKFVEIQEGAVWLTSARGKGSTFSFALPLHSREAEDAAAPVLDRPLPGSSRILVVEDDFDAYEALAKPLLAAGFFPIRARHGEEALEMARRLKPTAITLDLGLPSLSGWDVLKDLKKDPLVRGVPVVIVSMMDNRELGLALGAADYFLKPVDREQLVARLKDLVPPAKPPAISRLLVVDDDPLIHELLGQDLTTQGYAVAHARSGAEGIELATREIPDVVILDLVMPDVTGFEVAERLRNGQQTAHVPVVILTAKDLSEGDRESLRGKIAALVQKDHATPERLVEVIRELENRQESAGGR